MNIATVIGNLKTYLEGLSWTSASGTGTTSFSSVYTYDNIINDDGYPYIIINDSGETSESLDNQTLMGDVTISLIVATRWDGIDAQDDNERMEEGALRIREATDALKTNLSLNSLQTTLGVDWSMEWSYGDIELVSESNLLRRTFTLIIKETIAR